MNTPAFAPRLELRQGQQLVMTQSLQQSIKLLQLNSLELRAFIDQELENNPFLDMQEPEGDAPGTEHEPSPDDTKSDEPLAVDARDDWGAIEGDSRDIEQDYLGGDHYGDVKQGGFDDEPAFEQVDDTLSLREHMLKQLTLDITDPIHRLIGAHLIDLIDEAGYIKEDLASEAEKLGVSEKEMLMILAKIQRFEPAGIAARNLKECLSLQLKERDRLDPAMELFLDNLPLLAEARFEQLAKKCGVSLEDVREMAAEIRSLNPKPGASFSHEALTITEPDIFVRRLPDGKWHVELNMANFPKVMVNKRYYKQVSKESRSAKDKEFVLERFGSANWLVRALEQRADTMLKVASELVRQQDAFFRLGVKYLKPMTLKDIAAETGYHESTISRITTSKFLICPRGAFELKYFFTSALARSHGGEDVSSSAVKQYIEELIKAETPEAILSDDDIVERLKERSINVARRTVAKYREALGIPSSPKRKRLKLCAV
jgi:RNA polymerase sigma-54 factor